MRRANTTSVVLTVLSSVWGTIAIARAASLTDACSLLTVDQVSSAMGTAVGAPQKISTATCQWTVPGTMNRVTLMSSGAEAFNFWKKPLNPNVQSTPVSGVGDDAYFLKMAKQTGLAVKKGDTYFKLQVYSTVADDQKQAAEKQLATIVASKL
jgi:hypothetical protein